MSHPVASSVLLEQLKWRYATKKFDAARKIPADQWKTLEESLVLSPSSYGLQPWKFFIITDPAVRAKLISASWGQKQIVDASHLVVFAVKKNMDAAHVEHFIQKIAKVRSVPASSLEGYKQIMLGFVANAQKGALDINVWAAHQIYIALGQFLASAAMLGIDACPMEGFEPAKYDEILGLSAKGYGAKVLATAGFRATDDAYASAPKVRFNADEVIEHI